MEYIAGRKPDSEILSALTFNDALATDLQSIEDIQCLKCEKRCKFPTEKDDYLAHLFLVHRLVVADVEEVALLSEYFKTWQKDFENCELEVYCTTMLLDQLPDGTPSKNEKYYLLSDVLPKDFELRKRLHQHRLEKALARHQFERTDRNFSKECLYCRDIVTGLRAEYLEHLFNKHFLQLGKPENLVYVDDLISKVQHNLELLVCLYCEKIFKDRITLKEHMRKKAHKRINPNNREYDRFFLVNYRNEKTKQTPTKTIHKPRLEKRVLPRDDAETQRQRQSDEGSVDFDRHFGRRKNGEDDDEDSDWSDWDGELQPPLNCLFCTQQDANFDLLKRHMLHTHLVDFDAGVQPLNFYQRVKVVNYVRRQMCLLRCVCCNLRFESMDSLLAHMTCEQHYGLGTQKQWDKPEYFFPTYEDDGLLCVLDDNPNDDVDEAVVRIISEDTVAKINKDAERLSLENFPYL